MCLLFSLVGAVAGCGAGLVAAWLGRSRGDSCAADLACPAAGGAAIGLVTAMLMHGLDAWAGAVLGWWLLALGLVDARHFWLPRQLTLPLTAAGLLATVLLDPPAIADHAIGAAAGYLVLAGVATLYRRTRGRDGLGGGDAKLFAAGGAWLGWAALPAVLGAASAGGLAVALIVWRGRPPASARLPFGVFLGGATWAGYLLR